MAFFASGRSLKRFEDKSHTVKQIASRMAVFLGRTFRLMVDCLILVQPEHCLHGAA
jgi:hypothetical protein